MMFLVTSQTVNKKVKMALAGACRLHMKHWSPYFNGYNWYFWEKKTRIFILNYDCQLTEAISIIQ